MFKIKLWLYWPFIFYIFSTSTTFSLFKQTRNIQQQKCNFLSIIFTFFNKAAVKKRFIFNVSEPLMRRVQNWMTVNLSKAVRSTFRVASVPYVVMCRKTREIFNWLITSASAVTLLFMALCAKGNIWHRANIRVAKWHFRINYTIITHHLWA